MTKDTAKDILLEIGVEELPARFVPSALEALASLARDAFEAAGLPYQSLRTMGTPRRLALLADRVPAKAEDRVHESLGPGLPQSKDKEGNWTPAAQGFARSQGVPLESLEIRETDRGPRLCAVRKEAGRPADKILADLFPALIKKIPFAKNMVWEESRFPFARPIRWIAALHGTAPVKFTLAGVRSGNKTFGLRVHGSKPLPIPSPSKYPAFLKDRLVVVDSAERRSLVERQIQTALASVKGRVRLEACRELLAEVTNLVEHPVGILGSFDPKFLQLPAEVLTTSMKKHQKYFPVEDEDGRLLPHFVGIRNGFSENQPVVREGYERVLAARLADAAFFFSEDRKTSLMDKTPLLKDVLFQKALGSVGDKVTRASALAVVLADRLGFSSEEKSDAECVLCLGKADLVSAMVGEFPELQGVMGRLYAQAENLSDRVARGIEQHYWPLTAEGPLPEDPVAALCSLGDKLDTLAGDFLVGLVPSGSQDPYGLRRASVGVLRLLEGRGWRLSLRSVLEAALEAFPPNVKGDRVKTREVLEDFFRQRWSALREAEGVRPDEVQAVTAAGFDDPVDAGSRLAALRRVRRLPDFEPLTTAFKRAMNLVKQAGKAEDVRTSRQALPIREDLLADPAEKDLFHVYLNLRERGNPLRAESRYEEFLTLLAGFREPVDRFFKEVMVMAPEPEVRGNRIALLANIARLFVDVADLSCLQESSAGA